MHVSSIILDVHGLMLFELIFLAKILERRKEIHSHNIYPIHFFLLCKRYQSNMGRS